MLQCCQFDAEDRPDTKQLLALFEGALDPAQWAFTAVQTTPTDGESPDSPEEAEGSA
jgi:hypothetical protein